MLGSTLGDPYPREDDEDIFAEDPEDGDLAVYVVEDVAETPGESAEAVVPQHKMMNLMSLNDNKVS